jgi:hypothetical protein
MTTHAKLSASGSHRWLHCPGSIEAERSFPRTSSSAAEEGTAAHELAEIMLRTGNNCADYVGQQLLENTAYTVTEEMADYVQQYVDYVRSFSGQHEYEQRVDFSEWVPEGFGTADALVLSDTTLRVIDLKYGKGVLVEAFENTQGLLYALGAVSEYELIATVERIVICIVQPRRDHIDEWELTYDELQKWGEWIKQRAEDACKPEAPRIPGEKQCQWCAAKATCPALLKLTHETIGADFDNLDDLANPDVLPDERLKQALDVKKLVMSWFDAVEQHAFEKLEKGEPFPGYKLVEGRSLRQWADESEAEQKLLTLLDNAAYEKSLLSVAKAEKVLGKKRVGEIADLITKPKGKPTLAPESDKRPPIGATVDDFD